MTNAPPPAISLRLARPSELTSIVAIDDAATILYAQAGVTIDLPPEHPFVRAEVERWTRGIAEDRLFVAVDDADVPMGFAAMDRVDELPYLDQLAVHPRHMRQSVGAALVRRAIEHAAGEPLWLTTYDHLPFNRPYYERLGFVRVPEAQCGRELGRILASQRQVLPLPELRVAMVRARG
jgi:GNAT superfamily N-acetyltransferase